MSIDWQSILSGVGIFGAIIGGIVYLLKELGKHAIDRRLKAYEKELDVKSQEYQASLNTDLESHKAKLNIEHTQYLKLQERRLEIMAELYKRISELDAAMRWLILEIKPMPLNKNQEQFDSENLDKAHIAYGNFSSYYMDHKIFFSDDHCELLSQLQKKYTESYWNSTYRQRMGNHDPEYQRERLKIATDIVREEIPEITASLEKEFRMGLGVK